MGVFVCNCGLNIGGIADVPALVEYAKDIPDVAYTQANLFSCSQDAQSQMAEVIKENKLNRVVVAACSPSTHQPIFQDMLRTAGLNKYLFEMANIRNQCTWVHQAEPEAATEKCKGPDPHGAWPRPACCSPWNTCRYPSTRRPWWWEAVWPA